MRGFESDSSSAERERTLLALGTTTIGAGEVERRLVAWILTSHKLSEKWIYFIEIHL
jgi:hypothetical protein